jgi:oligoribonuclease NrnB/cAMP/cGMP phosphodiesterase (DHH superfamily)
VNRVCFYHAGCPDGFGAAWAARKAWGEAARYVAHRHENAIDVDDYRGFEVAFVDIAPTNPELLALARVAEHVVVLDHHVTARDRYHEEPPLVNAVEDLGHDIVYELGHSGAVLSWGYFCEGEPPELLRYVEDQDLWNWALAGSREVNAAIGAYPYTFEVWDELAARPIAELVAEGSSIVRANRAEVERRARAAHPLVVDGRLVEAVNATTVRSAIGHELAERKAFGVEWGCVYRLSADRVHATLYSIGDVDVGSVAARLGGGGHRNAAGFTVDLARWLKEFVEPAR